MSGEENGKGAFSTELNLPDPNRPYFFSEYEQIIPTLPYPPEIKADDLVRDLLSKYETKSPKMLNEFFIYRKAFVQAFKKQKLRPKMTHVSSLASTSWHSESNDVKNAYRKIAREAEQLYINERKRRQQQKTIDKIQTSESKVTSTSISSGSTYPVVSSPSHNTVVNVTPRPLIDFKPNLQVLDTNASSAFNGSYEQTCPTSFEDYYSNPIMYIQDPQPTEERYHRTFNTKNSLYNSNISGTQYPYTQTSNQALNSHNISDYINGGGPLGSPVSIR